MIYVHREIVETAPVLFIGFSRRSTQIMRRLRTEIVNHNDQRSQKSPSKAYTTLYRELQCYGYPERVDEYHCWLG